MWVWLFAAPWPALGQLGTAPAGSHYSATGQAFVEPEVVQSSGGSLTVTLEFGRFTYTGPDGRSIQTRAYAGRIPGPTLRFKRGDTVNVLLRNMLPTTCPSGTINTLRDYCMTNLHTHGLHVSPNSPQDDVHLKVAPSGSFQHVYSIPANHLGGTHWYHPHHHGNTALPVMGGASGMIIVDDDASDALPTEFSGMPEKVMFMTVFDADMAQAETQAGGSWATTSPTQSLVINGQSAPRITIAADQWLRLRFVLSAVQHVVSVPPPSGCEFMLLAKDGVWLPTGARSVTALQFVPGTRADVACRCSVGTFNLQTNGALQLAGGPGGPGGRRLQGGGGGGGGGLGGGVQVFPTQVIATIEATNQGQTRTNLPPLTVNFPTYLADLRQAAIANQMNNIQLQGGQACQFTCGAYNHDTVTEFISLSQTHQWTVNAAAHPLHVHVNHFQLASVTNQPFGDTWHQPGDWMDTFMGAGTVRFLADTFTGEVIAHCHLLIHEDQGCMARFHILTDATAYAGQTCVNYPVPTYTDTTTTTASTGTAASSSAGNSTSSSLTGSSAGSTSPVSTSDSTSLGTAKHARLVITFLALAFCHNG